MKRLYRSKKDRMIAGVCGGLAGYFDVDPVLVRAAFALAGFMGGMGVVLYILLAVITPEEGSEMTIQSESVSGEQKTGPATIEEPPLQLPQMNQDKRWVFGIILLGLGVFMLLGTLPAVIPWWGWNFLWPIVFILIGLYIFTRYRTKP